LLVLVHEAAQDVPAPRRRLVRPPAEKDPSCIVDDEAADGWRGLRIDNEPARIATHRVGLSSKIRRTARTVLPAVELAHARTVPGERVDTNSADVSWVSTGPAELSPSGL
jgi:hypothetical protein